MALKPNPRLSIVIPTYNRSDFLDYSLECHVPLAKAHNIQIFISDNASEDATNDVVNKWIKSYPLIRYCRNSHNIGFDGNFERALRQPSTDYVWLLSDTSSLSKQIFLRVMSCVDKDYDAIVLNDSGRVVDVPGGILRDPQVILENLGWHMTKISTLVFNRRILESASFDRYYDTYLVHVGVIFEYMAGKKDSAVMWLPDCSIVELKKSGLTKLSWEDKTFDIWTSRWPSLILSLPPAYDLSSKLNTIKKHNFRSGLFSIINLVKLRSKNIYSCDTLVGLTDCIFIALPWKSIFFAFVISLVPSWVLKSLLSSLRKLNKYLG